MNPEPLTEEAAARVIEKQKKLTLATLFALPIGVALSMLIGYEMWRSGTAFGIIKWWVPVVNGLLLTAAWVQVWRYRGNLMTFTSQP